MDRIRLFIENEEVELSNKVEFAINKQFDDLTDPPSIITEWSKTVSIPASINNNKLFGSLFRADRTQVAGEGVGMLFDPNKKLDMKLFYGDSLLMKGYAKFIKVKRKSGQITYEINLFSELGKVFKEMQKITFDPAEQEEGYYINTKSYFYTPINKELVNDSWTRSRLKKQFIKPDVYNPTTGKVIKYDSFNYRYYIGFTPLNTYYDDFDHKTFENEENVTMNFEDVLTDAWNARHYNNDIDKESLIGDGLLPRSYGEFRSYYQLPYIYFDAFFDIFNKKVKEKTGYDLTLHLEDTKLAENLEKLVFLGKNLYNSSELEKEDYNINTLYSSHIGSENAGYVIDPFNYYYSLNGTGNMNAVATIPVSIDIESETTTINNRIPLSEDYDILVEGVIPVRYLFYNAYIDSSSVVHDIKIRNNSYCIIKVIYTGENGHKEEVVNKILSTDTILDVSNDKSNLFYTDVANDILVPPMKRCKYLDVNINASKKLKKYVFGNYVNISLEFSYYEKDYSNNPFTFISNTGSDITGLYVGLKQNTVFTTSKISGAKRSNDYFSINDLWDNNVKPFDFLLNFTKMIGAVWTIDYDSKLINIIDRHKYFQNYSIDDWSDKVDYSQDYEIAQVSFGHRYMNFNYDECESKNGQKYSSEYGVEYGGIKVNTDYAFDSETEDLYDGLKTSIIYTPTIMDWSHMVEKRWVYIGTDDRIIYVSDEDNKCIESFGSFYFETSPTEWDENAEPVIISDDSPFMEDTDTYTYINTGTDPKYPDRMKDYRISSTTYSRLDVVDNTKTFILLFNKPMKSYDTTTKYQDVDHSIYTDYWEKYINERYNNQNKVITCYLRLTVQDYMNFDFYKFVTINNMLYMVNKIYDYNPNNLTTKVDLISISDIDAYIS